jgi:hypothetical protein
MSHKDVAQGVAQILSSQGLRAQGSTRRARLERARHRKARKAYKGSGMIYSSHVVRVCMYICDASLQHQRQASLSLSIESTRQ